MFAMLGTMDNISQHNAGLLLGRDFVLLKW